MSDLNYRLIVLIKTRPNLRTDEMTVFIGQMFLSTLFDSEDVMSHKEVTLMYPERWLNVLEQRALFDALNDRTRCPNLVEVNIITHSVYIIQCVSNEHISIIDRSSDYPETPWGPDIRYSPKPNDNLTDLNIFGDNVIKFTR
jgi:hypothetical protein